MSGLLDPILHASPVLLLVIAGLVVFAEDAIFIGFVIPGETAAVLAGVGAGLGRVPLMLSLVVVVVAAILGDTVGYEVGRHLFGPKVLDSRLLRGHRDGIDRAGDFLRDNGGLAVFLGRFTAFFRAVMPALAGAARMPYLRFLVWNAVGGVLWGVAFVLLGYFAGESYHRIEHLVGRSTAIALAVLVVIAIVVWRVRKHHREHHRGNAHSNPDHSQRAVE